MKNVCVVGFGSIGPVHAEAISRTENVKLYAICDINKERADSGAEQYGCRAIYDFQEVLDNDDIHSVHICTPHYLHHEMVIEASKKGKEIVVEKPLAVNKDALEKLRQEVKDTKICVMLQNRMNLSSIKMKEVFDNDSTLGEFRGGFASMTWSRREEYYAQDEWRGKWATEGGGAMINQAIHLVDLVSYICGDIKSVQASISNKSLKNVIEVEDTCDAIFKLENGKKVMLYATNAYTSNLPFRLELQFKNAIIRYADECLTKIERGKSVELLATNDNRYLGKPYWGISHMKVIENFYNGGEYPTINDAQNTMDALFAIYESANNDSSEIEI